MKGADAQRGFAARISAAPLPFDRDIGAEVAATLGGPFASGPGRELVLGAAGSSPYLARLMRRHGAWLSDAAVLAPETVLADLLAHLGEGAADQRSLGEALRTAKGRVALLTALADLGGVWGLDEVTGALSDFADAALETGLAHLLGAEIARGRLPGLTPEDVPGRCGYVVLAMGKHGARELNFSSDIDLICLFDQDRFAPEDYADVKARFLPLTRGLVKLLSEQTGAGYVFRTDLRLRPAPSTTGVCLAMEAAERYYESEGRTWERAAHIKARVAAGDRAAGADYLDRLAPFVWRRSLDFFAIQEVHGLLQQIRAKGGRFTTATLPGHDMKLGPGGIREIEFFAQTRQLVLGGRAPALRVPQTRGALAALAEAGQIDEDARATLDADYVAHRTLEHRLQMVEDAQTHSFPTSQEGRDRIAALAGAADRAAFERAIAARLDRVHATIEQFFGHAANGAHAAPAHTEPHLDAFARPEDAKRMIRRWGSGDIPATRSERARSLFAGLEPRVLAELARAGSPDEAIAEFDRFLSGLPSGVQVFSLFAANPELLDLIVRIVAASPRLARHLGREPQALDALIAGDFFDPMPGEDVLVGDLRLWLAREADYERKLDATRRWAREQRFRAGVQVLNGTAGPREAGAAFSAIAIACLAALEPEVIAEFARRHGPPPGRGMAVIALGKLGTREMTAGSDLDLITVYDAAGAEMSDGPRPLPPATYFPRLTQALVAALTAPTAQGRLYEVDMRLRPSGRQGPVAVSLESFARYQREAAWVWEHMAMTRARVVLGAGDLRLEVEAEIASALAARRGDPRVVTEAAEMRRRLLVAHAPDRGHRWTLKHAAGGLMEIEFLAQTGGLLYGLRHGQAALEIVPQLADAGWLGDGDARHLTHAFMLQAALQQVQRAALDEPVTPDRMGLALRSALARSAQAPDFETLETALEQAQCRAAEVVARRFATLAG